VITPLISVVIPTYNASSFIGSAIDSVLGQTYKNIEIIVVDDGSIDSTAAALRPYGKTIRYVRQNNKGVSAARNHGIQLARGEVIAFLDADDIWLPQKLEVQLQYFSRHKEAALVFGDIELFGDGKIFAPSFLALKEHARCFKGQDVTFNDAFGMLLKENVVPTSTVAITRHALQRIGHFDESLSSVEDRDLWLRVAAEFPIGCVPIVMCRKRVRDSSLSSDYAQTARNLLKVLEKHASGGVLPSRAEHASAIQSMLAHIHLEIGYAHFAEDDLGRARQHFKVSLSKRLGGKLLLYYGLTFFDPRVLRSLKLIKRKLLGESNP
jgi:glycosyltransferase involved in cell wall biosynthesis